MPGITTSVSRRSIVPAVRGRDSSASAPSPRRARCSRLSLERRRTASGRASARPRRAGSSRARRATGRLRSAGRGAAGVADGGEVDRERRAAARLAVDHDVAAALLHDAVDGRRGRGPVPFAGSLVVKNGSKMRACVASVHADAGVADREHRRSGPARRRRARAARRLVERRRCAVAIVERAAVAASRRAR